MDSQLALQIANGIIILLTSLTLISMRAIFKWVVSVNKRLDEMENRTMENKPKDDE